MTTVNKEIASMFSPGAERAILARGKRGDGVSEEFPGDRGESSEPDSERAKGFQPIYDGQGGSERAHVDATDGTTGVPDKEKPARLDGRDGEGDELADAQLHQLAVSHDDPDVPARICSGEGCTQDHVARAAELLHKHMSLRESVVGSHGRVRFQR